MLIGTGLRAEELLALQVGDVEINGRSGQVTVRKGKHSNQRDVPLKAEVRHTFSEYYLRGNPDDLRGLAALLGHTNLNTVMIYTEPSFDDLAERVERVQ